MYVPSYFPSYCGYTRLLTLAHMPLHMPVRARYLVIAPSRLLALHSHMSSVLELHQKWTQGLEAAQVSTCQ